MNNEVMIVTLLGASSSKQSTCAAGASITYNSTVCLAGFSQRVVASEFMSFSRLLNRLTLSQLFLCHAGGPFDEFSCICQIKALLTLLVVIVELGWGREKVLETQPSTIASASQRRWTAMSHMSHVTKAALSLLRLSLGRLTALSRAVHITNASPQCSQASLQVTLLSCPNSMCHILACKVAFVYGGLLRG